MSIETETRIRDLYRRVREEDEESAPTFAQIVEGGQSKPRGGIWAFRLGRALALLGVAVFLVPVFFYLTRGPVAPGEQMATDLLEWESPTDVLLTFSDDSLWAALPAVDVELPEWVENEYEE